MATVNRWYLLAATLAGCGNLEGFAGEASPLATITITTSGDFASVQDPKLDNPDLRVALVWGKQWLPEAMCILPPESAEVAAVVAAGCRNPLSFTPAFVAADAVLVPNEPVELTVSDLPSSALMVGDVTARVAYASLVVYDDRDHDGILQPTGTKRVPGGGDHGPDMEVMTMGEPVSEVYGASFVAMTEPDTRLAFREGAFIESGFYPRHGCSAPLPAFSILSAGGFSFADALVATAAGELPSEDPATCTEGTPDDVTVTIPFRRREEVRETICMQGAEDSTVRYREPPPDPPPDFSQRTFACASIPNLGGDPIAPEGTIQLVLASLPTDACHSLTHLTLFGCDESTSLTCDSPEWDFRANPPAWWPCPVQAAR